MVIYKEIIANILRRFGRGKIVEHKQRREAAIQMAVRKALLQIGIETIKSGPFFGIGEYREIKKEEAA